MIESIIIASAVVILVVLLLLDFFRPSFEISEGILYLWYNHIEGQSIKKHRKKLFELWKT